ncbi:unnamed protein product, partial [Closterium sp. Yama58-4]
MSCWAPLARLGACAPSNGIVACLNACDGPTIDCYDTCYTASGWLPPLSTAELIAFPISACCLLAMSLVISCMMSSTLGLDMATLQAAMDGVDERLRWQAAKVAALRTRGSLLLTTLLVASTSVNVSFTLFVSGGAQVGSCRLRWGSGEARVGSGGAKVGFRWGSGGVRCVSPSVLLIFHSVEIAPLMDLTPLYPHLIHTPRRVGHGDGLRPLCAAHPPLRRNHSSHASHPTSLLPTPLYPTLPPSPGVLGMMMGFILCVLLFVEIAPPAICVLGIVMGFVLCVLLILLFVLISPLICSTMSHHSPPLSTPPSRSPRRVGHGDGLNPLRAAHPALRVDHSPPSTYPLRPFSTAPHPAPPALPGVLGMVMGFILCVLFILLFVEIALVIHSPRSTTPHRSSPAPPPRRVGHGDGLHPLCAAHPPLRRNRSPPICARHSLRIASATAWLARLLLLLLSPVAYPVSLLLDRYLNNQEDEEERSLRRGLLCGGSSCTDPYCMKHGGSAGSSPRIYITNPLANPPSLEFPDTTASALDTGSEQTEERDEEEEEEESAALYSEDMDSNTRMHMAGFGAMPPRSGPYDSSRSKPVSGGSDSPLRRRIEQAADRAAAAAGVPPSTPAAASTGGGESGRKTESGTVGESGAIGESAEEVVMALPVGESQEYTSVEVGEEGEGYSTREEEISEKVGRGGRSGRGGSGRGGSGRGGSGRGAEETAEESDEVPMALPTSDDVDGESDDQRRNVGR